MGRPSRQNKLVHVKERIREVFWQLYQTKPVGRITVREVIELAKCNRTTFYYHYCDMYAVLEDIEELCLPLELPEIIVQILTGAADYGEIAKFMAGHHDLYTRICFLLSAKGDPQFARKFKNQMLDCWALAAGLDLAALDKLARLRLELIIGGVMSLFACCGNGEDIELKEIAETMQTVIRLLPPAKQV